MNAFFRHLFPKLAGCKGPGTSSGLCIRFLQGCWKYYHLGRPSTMLMSILLPGGVGRLITQLLGSLSERAATVCTQGGVISHFM